MAINALLNFAKHPYDLLVLINVAVQQIHFCVSSQYGFMVMEELTTLTVIICGILVIGTFLLMEGVAWFTHKYVMHGFLWIWHESHHKVHDHTLERNDLFALVFSLPSIVLLAFNWDSNPYWTAVGIGIFCYGVFYIVFHDIIVHQRIKWFPKKRSKYLQRMIRAHYIHHKVHSKEGAEAFGFLYAPKKFDKRAVDHKKEAATAV